MFAERLKLLRKENNMTQAELAKKINKSRASIAGYETSDRTPDIETVGLIADLFDENIDWLLGRTDERSVSLNLTMPNFLLNKLEQIAKSSDSSLLTTNSIGEFILNEDSFMKIINDPDIQKKRDEELSLINSLLRLFNIPQTPETREEFLFFLMELSNKYSVK